MGSEKRARQKQNRQARLQAERRAARLAKWRRRIVSGLVIAAIVVAVFVIGNLVTGGDRPAEPAPVQTSVTDESKPDD